MYCHTTSPGTLRDCTLGPGQPPLLIRDKSLGQTSWSLNTGNLLNATNNTYMQQSKSSLCELPPCCLAGLPKSCPPNQECIQRKDDNRQEGKTHIHATENRDNRQERRTPPHIHATEQVSPSASFPPAALQAFHAAGSEVVSAEPGMYPVPKGGITQPV